MCHVPQIVNNLYYLQTSWFLNALEIGKKQVASFLPDMQL